VAVQEPSYLGSVYVRRLPDGEDRWTGLWLRGRDKRTTEGTKAEVLRWARDQGAGHSSIYDEGQGDYVPLADEETP
jgi:hypothetical protein